MEWKRRLLEYIAIVGRDCAYRVPLVDALLASPFPKDAPAEEVAQAMEKPAEYLRAKLGDAVAVYHEKRWSSSVAAKNQYA